MRRVTLIWVRGLFLVLLAVTLVLGGIFVEQAIAKETKNVVMILWREKDKSEEGFQQALAKSDYTINLKEYNAEQKKDKLAEIIKGLDLTKIDLIYAFGSTVAKDLKDAVKDVPIVFNIVADPVGLGLIDSWERSGNNISGMSNAVPTEAQLKSLRKIFNFKRLGMIHNPKEKNSVLLLEQAKALEKELDFTVVVANFTGKDDLESAMQALKQGQADAVWLPSVSAIKSNSDILLKAIDESKIPSITAFTELAKIKDKDAALIALGADYYKLGLAAGEKAIQILSGRKPTDVPSEILKTFDLIINLVTADKIGIKIPMDILKMATQIIK